MFKLFLRILIKAMFILLSLYLIMILYPVASF